MAELVSAAGSPSPRRRRGSAASSLAPDDLDSIVKGAPVPAAPAASASVLSAVGTTPILPPGPSAGRQADPLNQAPSSPSMIYLNLLILEASLRAQFLELRARRRHHIFFLALLSLWVLFFGYKLHLAPREDGRGVGGSIYWAVEGVQKVCFMGGIITAVLVWATGIWERGIRWPRRWFAISNRGLRAFNCKLVIVRQPWWAEALSTVAFFLTYGFFSHTASSSYRRLPPALLRETDAELHPAATHASHHLATAHHDDHLAGREEDLAPGGDYVKLLLLAKPFSATFRENWELYRTEYWERENERRALLQKRVKEHDRRVAKKLHGWLWWLPWHRPSSSLHPRHHASPPPMVTTMTTTAAAAAAAASAATATSMSATAAGTSTPSRRHHDLHKSPSLARHAGGGGGGGGGGGAEKSSRKQRSGSGSTSLRRLSASSSSRNPAIVVEAEAGLPSRQSSLASTDSRRRRPASGSKSRGSGSSDSRSVTPDMSIPTSRDTVQRAASPDAGRVLRSATAAASTRRSAVAAQRPPSSHEGGDRPPV